MLNKILSFVQTERDKKKEGKGGLVGGLLAGLFAIILISLFAFKAWRSGKEKAKLLHEKAVREEDLHQAEVDAQLSEADYHKRSAQVEVERISASLDELKKKQEAIEEQHERAQALVDSLKTWDDVDALRD